jgi:hypothetical protein
MERKQRMVLYFDNISMKNSSRVNQVNVIRILTSGGMVTLCQVLGVGIGVCLGKEQPSKSNPLVHCCVNDVITSLEFPDEIPPIFLVKPKTPLFFNGLDLSFTVETSFLCCNVRFSKVMVTNEDIVIIQLQMAVIHRNEVIPYVGAMFCYGNDNLMCRINIIEGGFAFCSYMDDEHPPFCISLEDLSPLVASFGQPH